jgi:hypothetical protein
MAVSKFQRVALTRDIAEHRLCAGDVACVVDFVPHPSAGEPGCVLEVFNAIGESIALVTVPVSAVEPLAADEVFAVRRLADQKRSRLAADVREAREEFAGEKAQLLDIDSLTAELQ